MNILLTSSSSHKVNTLTSLLKKVYKEYKLTSIKTNTLQEQPINNTLECAKYRTNGILLNENDYILSIENGIELVNDKYIEVCVLYVKSKEGKETFYKSFGIEIPIELVNEYLDDKYKTTFGQFLELYYQIDPTNWMKDYRFGNIDRSVMISDVVIQWLIDINTRVIIDFPKTGIKFKDVCSLLENNIMIDLLLQQVDVYLNINQYKIDGFAGLQSRGFLLATILSHKYKKEFLALRKLDKLPHNKDDKLIIQNYETEYSKDSLAIISNSKNEGKNYFIVDDLLATGGTFFGAKQILEKNNINILGYIVVYDVEELRPINLNNVIVLCRPNDSNINHVIKTQLASKISPSITIKNNINSSIISCSKSNILGELISTKLQIPISLNVIDKFNNGEIRVEINSSIRGQHVIVVCQTQTNSINDDIIELMMVLDACNRSGASNISVILPYYPYS